MPKSPVPTVATASPKTLNLATLVRNSGISYGGTIAVMAIGIGTKAVQARLLTPKDLGVLLTAQTLAALAATAAQLSIPETLVRFIGRAGSADTGYASALVNTSLRVAIGFSLLLVALAIVFRDLAARVYHEPSMGPVLVILMFAVPLNSAAAVLCSAYRGMGRMWEKVVFIDTVPAVFVTLGLIIVSIAARGSLLLVAELYLGGSAVSVALSWWRYATDRSFKVQHKKAVSWDLVRFSAPLFAASLVAWPMSLIPLVLGTKNLDGVAYYNIAIALGSLSYTLVAAAETASLPVWSHQLAHGQLSQLRGDYAATASWCFIAGSIVFALLICCPADVIRILYGSKYIQGAYVVRLVAPLFLLNAATGPNESLLKALGETRWIFATRLAVGVSVAAATVALSAASGLMAAIGSYWLSSVVGIAMYAGYLAIVHHIDPISPGYLKSLAAVLLSLPIAFAAANQMHLQASPVNLVLTVTVYSSVLLLSLWVSGYSRSREGAQLVAVIQGILARTRVASAGRIA